LQRVTIRNIFECVFFSSQFGPRMCILLVGLVVECVYTQFVDGSLKFYAVEFFYFAEKIFKALLSVKHETMVVDKTKISCPFIL